MATNATAVILFDGVCAFCDRYVNWMLDIDQERKFRFAPLQGETAKAILARHPELPRNLDSVILVETVDGVERLFWHSTAALRIFDRLGIDSLWIRFGKRLPRPLLDVGYRLFAALRYRLFGKLDQCRMASPAERELFLP